MWLSCDIVRLEAAGLETTTPSNSAPIDTEAPFLAGAGPSDVKKSYAFYERSMIIFYAS